MTTWPIPGNSTSRHSSPGSEGPRVQAFLRLNFLNIDHCSTPNYPYSYLPSLSRNISMASRYLVTRALRSFPSTITRHVATPLLQRRAFVALSRASLEVAAAPVQQHRGLKTIDFAGHKETVYGMSNIAILWQLTADPNT